MASPKESAALARDQGGAAPRLSSNFNSDADKLTRPFGLDQAMGRHATANPLLDAALAYAARGLPLFPLRGKVPAIAKDRGGRGVHDATTEADQIRAWWGSMPWANIGLAAGEGSGFWVLDVDPKHGGDAALATLEAEHGPLPATVEQITGTGGWHYLFAANGEAVRNRAGERHHLPPGLDTRATGGYIVAAPSVHPETGQRYAWHPERHLLRHPLATAPAWLVALVAPEPAPAPVAAPARRPPPPSSWGPKAAYAQAALDRAARAIAAASPGSQEATLNGEAFSIGRLIGAGLMPADFARSVLIRAGTLMTNAPGRRRWTAPEIERKVDRALDAGRRQPREVPR